MVKRHASSGASANPIRDIISRANADERAANRFMDTLFGPTYERLPPNQKELIDAVILAELYDALEQENSPIKSGGIFDRLAAEEEITTRRAHYMGELPKGNVELIQYMLSRKPEAARIMRRNVLHSTQEITFLITKLDNLPQQARPGSGAGMVRD